MSDIERDAIIDDAVTEIGQMIQDEDGNPMPGDWLQDRAEEIVGRLADDYLGAVEAIAAHRAAIERIGTVSVADDESRARAQAKHEADLALWRYGGQ